MGKVGLCRRTGPTDQGSRLLLIAQNLCQKAPDVVDDPPLPLTSQESLTSIQMQRLTNLHGAFSLRSVGRSQLSLRLPLSPWGQGLTVCPLPEDSGLLGCSEAATPIPALAFLLLVPLSACPTGMSLTCAFPLLQFSLALHPPPDSNSSAAGGEGGGADPNPLATPLPSPVPTRAQAIAHWSLGLAWDTCVYVGST